MGSFLAMYRTLPHGRAPRSMNFGHSPLLLFHSSCPIPRLHFLFAIELSPDLISLSLPANSLFGELSLDTFANCPSLSTMYLPLPPLPSSSSLFSPIAATNLSTVNWWGILRSPETSKFSTPEVSQSCHTSSSHYIFFRFLSFSSSFELSFLFVHLVLLSCCRDISETSISGQLQDYTALPHYFLFASLPPFFLLTTLDCSLLLIWYADLWLLPTFLVISHPSLATRLMIPCTPHSSLSVLCSLDHERFSLLTFFFDFTLSVTIAVT